MKKYRIRLTALQGQWLQSQAEVQSLTISEVVRSILDTQRKSRAFCTVKALQKPPCSELELKLARYTLLSYQLLESLLFNEDPGSKRYDAAYASAVERMQELGIQGKHLKSYCLTVWVRGEQSQWLEQEALERGKMPTRILGEILVWSFVHSNDTSSFLNPAQREGIRFSIMICALLEQYILESYENGAELIAKVKQKSESLVQDWIEGGGPLL